MAVSNLATELLVAIFAMLGGRSALQPLVDDRDRIRALPTSWTSAAAAIARAEPVARQPDADRYLAVSGSINRGFRCVKRDLGLGQSIR